MRQNLSLTNGSHLRNLVLRLTSAALLSLLLAITASAYTLIFRDGRRLEIPDEFTLTRTTLTYEVSPGFSKTLQVTLIDVAATERANGETPGSFFRHREQMAAASVQPSAPVQSSAPVTRNAAVRTLTNSDLAAVRQRRIESEKAYEKRRLELGLPTVAESRRRQEEESSELRTRLREKSRAEASEEVYWRGRARALRTEIASVDAGINYLRGRLTELNETAAANRPIITEVYPLWPYDRRGGRGRNGRWGGVPQAQPPFGPAYPNRYPNGTYGYPNGPYGYPNGGYGYPPVYGYPNGGYGFPNGGYGYPSGPFGGVDNSAEQADVKGRLDELVVKRAALSAQWQALEDEARDARIPQVWLLP